MSAGSKATMLNGHPMNPTGFDWQGEALIRCIVWFGVFISIVQCSLGSDEDAD